MWPPTVAGNKGGMRVNVAVCGVFHHRKYIGELSRRGVLGAFYYAHRRSTTAEALGIVSGEAFNLFAKEYLYRGGTKLLGPRSGRWLGPLSHDLWQWQLLRNWRDCDVFHLMLHGTGIKALEHAKARGAATLGEPVNAHPEVTRELLVAEHERLGLPPPEQLPKTQRRLLQEVTLCDHLLVASGWIKRSFEQRGFPSERIHVIPYASDPTHFYPPDDAERAALRGSDRRFRVLCVAQLVVRKGVHHLLEAWRQLGWPASDAELVIVGRLSEEMAGVMKRYEGLYTYITAVPHEQLRREYGRADVFVLPSIEDGFGLVGVEAMGCGVPLLTTANAGVADVVKDGVTGFVVPAGSPEPLAERLGELYRDRDRARAMGTAAAEASRGQGGVTWAQHVDGLVKLYQDIARKPG